MQGNGSVSCVVPVLLLNSIHVSYSTVPDAEDVCIYSHILPAAIWLRGRTVISVNAITM